MKVSNEAKEVNGAVVPEHDIEIVCSNCGYDVDEAELNADICSDCGEPLNLKQSVAIRVTTLPPVFGDTM